MEYHDKVIGRLLDYLADQGLSEETLVIYTGDNGSPQEVCSIVHRHNEICGGKSTTNDHGTHVPLIAQMPGTVPAGVSEQRSGRRYRFSTDDVGCRGVPRHRKVT